MEFLAAGVVLALISLAKKKPGATAPATTTNTTAPNSTTAGGGGTLPIKVEDVAGVAGALGGIQAAVAAAYIVAGAAVGKAITGTDAGAVAGAVNPIVGNAVNVGTQVGKELDKVLGGRDGEATSIVAQAGIGATTGALVAFGPFGALFAVAFFQFTLLAYAIGSIISDINRLKYGQAGAQADYHREWLRIYGAAYDRLRAGVKIEDGSTVMLTDAEVNRIVWPWCDGYMRNRNRIAFHRWMRQPRGVGMTDASHADYGAIRGYFVGTVGAGSLVLEPALKCDSKDYAQYIPAREVTTVSLPVYQWFEIGVKGTVGPFTVFAHGAAPLSIDKQNPWLNVTGRDGMSYFDERKALADGFTTSTWERRQTGTQQGYSDPNRLAYAKEGEIGANTAAYLEWMFSPIATFHTEASHMVYGKNEGRFFGDNLGEGKIRYEGRDVDFRAFKTLKEGTTA